MKILITGMTKLQCFEDYYLKQELKVLPSERALVNGLRELGHDVTQKPVKWGEDLSEYEKVIAYGADTQQVLGPGAAFLDGLFWVLKTRKDALIAVDDWRTREVITTSKYMRKKLFTEIHRAKLNNAPLTEDDTDELYDLWLFDRHVLVPAFEGGDLSSLFDDGLRLCGNKKLASVNSYDPNPLLPLRRTKSFKALFSPPKKREWLAVALAAENRESWAKNGIKGKVNEIGGHGPTDTRVPEPDIINLFSDYWFHYVAPYSHAGSGWWRARPQQVTDAGSICWCCKAEAHLFGPTWEGLDPTSLVDLTDQELRDTHAKMKQEFFERHPVDDTGKARSLKKLEEFIKLT